ncbi:YceI family protein [Lishizhenia sp.]|uniref:YceI family protein n=1 Tax=Lishizhenia sp. TaxID=2497594 RepID=UPI00299E75E5|nr:YceI family protein [Lishizhenia sp.]MDX1447067.1 YceI family protein [Lishizhenia sp.]
MKKFYVAAFAFAALATTACTSEGEKVEETAADAVETPVVEEVTYNLDAEATTLNWTGSWVKEGEIQRSHNGAIKVSEGSLTMKGEEFVSGSFKVDMTSISNSDVEDAEKNGNLVGHLSDSTFFNVPEFPATDVKVNSFSGDVMNITITAVGQEFTQDINVSTTDAEGTMTLESSFAVDFGDALPYTNPEDKTNGHVSSEVAFDLKLVLNK